MINNTGELVQLSLTHLNDLPGFYASLREWFSEELGAESLVFYQPDPLANLSFEQNHKADPYVLKGDVHPPRDMEVSALQFREQGVCRDEFFLFHLQTEDTWYGAIEGSGSVPDTLEDHADTLSQLLELNVTAAHYGERARFHDHLLKAFSLLQAESEELEAYGELLSIVGEALDCDELGFYKENENHFELVTSLGFEADDWVNRQFYPREQLRQLGMDEKFHALEPSENSDDTDLFLPLTIANSREGLIVAYRTPYTHESVTELDQLTFKTMNILASMTVSVLETQLDQGHEEIWDRVTNLRTESFFLTRLDQEIERGDRYGYSFSLLLFEIENLDDLAEEFGESTLNELIRKLSHKVKTTFRIIDTACRFDNNQFGVLFPNTGREGAVRAGERLIELVDEPFLTIGERDISIRLDGGVAKYPEDGGDSEELMKQARLALYEAKQDETAQLRLSQEIEEE